MASQRVGRYTIVRRLGAGGMGEVYLAEDPTLNRHVAIKFLLSSVTGDDAAKARLVREARAAAALDHPNVCAIYEVDEHEGRPFFAMQYIEGITLADRLAQGPLPVGEAARAATQVADALADAHARGIIHRDIKPHNIMLTARDQVKVLDFGLAQVARPMDNASTIAATRAGMVAGTTAYMSNDIGHSRRRCPTLVSGPDLQQVVHKCLEKEPAGRYPSAADLLVDLRNFTRDSDASFPDARRVAKQRPRRRAMVIVAIVAAVFAVVAARVARRNEAAAVPSVRVIAILPLTTADESLAYLGDGISESVINSLSRLPQIKVLARPTTFRYRGANVDPASLRRDLGVDAVLMGTVARQGDALVVQAELIDTADNTQIWGQRYNNRRLADVFAVQEEIARAIAGSLRLELAGREAVFSKHDTANVEAYRLYVLGRERAQRRTVADLEAAANHFKQAIALDERYALAWAGLTDAYLNFAMPFPESRRRALEAAERARAIDPDLAEAHAALGQTYVYVGPFDFEAGDRALGRAIELNPGWPVARQYQAVSFLEQGRIEEGVRQLEIAHEQDPLSPFITRLLGFGYMLQGDLPRALATYRTVTSLGGQFATIWEAELFVRTGAIDEGLREIESAARGREDEPHIRFNRAVLQAAKGMKNDALDTARVFEQQAAADPVHARFAARIHAALGDYDRALALFSRSLDAGGVSIFYKDELLWAPVRNDPRFLELLARMRVPN